MRLLDLFCGAGGCAVGYHRAGFTEIVGVDHAPQPNYPFEFVRGDALEYLAEHGREFDAVHASPPCQAYSVATSRNARRRHRRHNDLVSPTRAILEEVSRPWVIENVPTAPLAWGLLLCGSMFGLDVRRHRLFEASFLLLSAGSCRHSRQTPRFRSPDSRRAGKLASVVGVYGHLNYSGEAELRNKAMGVDWMTQAELTQTIPPAYTEFIGRQLIAVAREAAT